VANIVKPPCDEGVITARSAAAPCDESSGRWVLAATILGSSMVFIDGTVVNVALPALQKSLNATVADVQWVVESYALFLATLILVGGSLGDRYGRRLIFCLGVSLFALASVGCGLANSIEQLILARAVQGVGGALLVPGSLAIIGASFGEARRGKAIGTWSGFTAITAALGPVLGGWLIEYVSWRAVFFLNLPIAAAVLLIAFWRVPESRDEEARGRLDFSGAALAVLGLGGVVYGLIESARVGFSHPNVVTSLVGGSLLLVLLLVVESRSPAPMLPLGLFRSRNFIGANLLTLLLYTALTGVLFFFPLNLIEVQGYSATAAGAAFLPFILIMFFLSRWSGGLVEHYGARVPLIVGPIIAAIGFALFAVPDISGSYWLSFFPAIVVLGLGMAVSVAPLTTVVMSSVGEAHVGIASGVNNAVARTAGLLAVAIFGIVMLRTFNASLDRYLDASDLPSGARIQLNVQRTKLAAAELPSDLTPESRAELKRILDESFVAGFRSVSLIAAGLSLLSSLSATLLIRQTTQATAPILLTLHRTEQFGESDIIH
jgi:EmrB/QacA subfamily drug resistance transporter